MKLIEESRDVFRFSGDHRFSIVCSVVLKICNTVARVDVKFT
jgi:hypothetical protein